LHPVTAAGHGSAVLFTAESEISMYVIVNFELTEKIKYKAKLPTNL
jgi:hypothetical protein